MKDSNSAPDSYDVAIVGAGPVGSLCALGHARKGARVALLEANPRASSRLAGEWLHPPAVRMLREIGVDLDTSPETSPGNGFVVFPEDSSNPIELPYPKGATGITCEHAVLVSKLHDALGEYSDVHHYENARVHTIENGGVKFSLDGTQHSLAADRLIGADGRASIVRKSLGLSPKRLTCSRMIGVVVDGINLPHEGYGHVILGGPGPILLFRLGAHQVRIIVDVPLDHWTPRDRVPMLTESYAHLLPISIREAFVSALLTGSFQAAGNELRPRATYGNSHRVLIGDAAGHYHPLTAVGITLGFSDALALAEARDFRHFMTHRMAEVRAPERFAFGLYEVFADYRPESVAFRQATYRSWRASSRVRKHTMNLLACESVSVVRLAITFCTIMSRAILDSIPKSFNPKSWQRAHKVTSALVLRVDYFQRGIRALKKNRDSTREENKPLWKNLSRSLLTSLQFIEPQSQTVDATANLASVDAEDALQSATAHLLKLQNADGSWEGEMVWCPMLTAQYVILSHIVGQDLDPHRKSLVLRQFERTRLSEGGWSLGEHAQPYLFVTTLVYVAARLLGAAKDDPLIKEAGQFIRKEDALGIPSWGKFWLAILNLYDWKGLNPVLPELWNLPRWFPLHPSKWYCHTRLIYMAMSVVYSNRFQLSVTPMIASLREELFAENFNEINFRSGHKRLRNEDVYKPPSFWLRGGYAITRMFERIHRKRHREKCVELLLERIRWELNSSDHTSISPVSGFLNILALWLTDPEDPDYRRALAQLEGWIWEDEEDGTRVTGARSASWDTGFALQALASTSNSAEVSNAIHRGVDFLLNQQIRDTFNGYEGFYRTDPRGGWCFAGVWHGWPVTDCTAEAVLGLIETRPTDIDLDVIREAIDFMLRGQNRDGGFGSYEARRSAFDLEWLNPAEMFGESMSEHSYVECTASCLAALAGSRNHFSSVTDEQVDRAISRGQDWLRWSQAHDGSWRGVWGVQFIYGTLFGIRGLLAAGAEKSDTALRLACRWLIDQQRSDGGWGEHFSGCLTGRYVPHQQSQVVQTAWALIALLEAGESNWQAISRGANFLVDAQLADGTWEREDMAGVFFRTALLDYALYRQYFPLRALSLYEQRRNARSLNTTSVSSPKQS